VALAVVAAAAGCDGDTGRSVVRIGDGPKTAIEPPVQKSGESIRIAFASVLSPEYTVEQLPVFSAYLSQKLGRPIEVVRRRTYEETNELLRIGKVDAALTCTGAYAIGRERFGFRAIAVPVVNGGTSYRAYVIVRRDHGAAKLQDLRGGVFAFSDPLSNSGYRHVADELHQSGTSPDTFFRHTFFTYSHDNTIRAVRDGLADGGVVDSLVWDSLVLLTPELDEELKIIETSGEFPINPIVVTSHTPAAVTTSLAGVLLAMANDPGASRALQSLGIEGFVAPDESRYDAIVDSWRRLGVLPPAASGGP
jgi:phosphonate transport system substrate-binding protein